MLYLSQSLWFQWFSMSSPCPLTHSQVVPSCWKHSYCIMSSHMLCIFPNPSVTRTRDLQRGPAPRGTSHEGWEACEWCTWAWCRLPSRGVHASHAVLSHDSLIVALSVSTGALFVRASQRLLQAFLLPLPWVKVRRVAHVVVHERVLDRFFLTLAVCGLADQITGAEA